MLTIERNDEAPQAVIHVAGTLRLSDLHEAVRQGVEQWPLPEGAVVLIEYAKPTKYRPAVIGVLLFLMDKLLSADPEAILIVRPEALEADSTSTREFRGRFAEDARVHRFTTRAEADAFIQKLKDPPPGEAPVP